MVPDPKLNLAREQVQIDFFRQHLGPRDLGVVAIVHQDARCVVADKPSGIATHRGWDDGEGNDPLLQRVRDLVGCYVYPIHRLESRRLGARAVRARWRRRA